MKNHAVSQHPIALSGVDRSAREGLVPFVMHRFLLLPLGAVIALVWANTAAESYFQVSHALSFAVNEIAMALFLALVAQDVLEALMPGGALYTWRRWGLPVVAAGGGIAGAAGAYYLYIRLSYEPLLMQAWPIACAVDVAAAYYVLKTIWRRSSALPFVLLLALVTDAFGLAIVALRPHGVAIQPVGVLLMLAAVGLAGLLRFRNVREFWPYIVSCGTLSWFALYFAGIHPALALLPIVPFLPREPRSMDLLEEPPDDDQVHHAEREWNEVVQVILFFFGLVNAGVIFKGYDTGSTAILVASLVGRPVGILAGIGVAVLAGFHVPRKLGWREMIVVALATSSGFTFALFFATGLLPMGPMLAQIKIGAIASVVTALLAMGLARAMRVGRFAP